MQKALFTCCFMMVFMSAFCQGQFIEGEIVYAVKIISADAKENKPDTGILTILVKANSVAKELALQSGFRNRIIFNQNENTAYSLRKIDGIQYAIQLDPEQIKRKREKCSKLERQELENDIPSKMGFATEKIRLTCNNSEPLIVYYTKVWQINNEQVFQDFPSFNYLPLSYMAKNEDGSVFNFELRKIEAKPIDNRMFAVPPGYKKVSQQESKSGKIR